jgi:hypothetical protein
MTSQLAVDVQYHPRSVSVPSYVMPVVISLVEKGTF